MLIEVNCETDFVARGDVFKALATDMAMQVAACEQVTVVDIADVPADLVEKERSIQMGKEDIVQKPEAIRSAFGCCPPCASLWHLPHATSHFSHPIIHPSMHPPTNPSIRFHTL